MDSMTELLGKAGAGDLGAADRLMKLVYDELKDVAARLMGAERQDHTLQPTALVHEAYLRLVGSEARTWENQAHFFAAAAGVLRRVLVDHARRRNRQKRGGGAQRLDLDAIALEAPIDRDELLAVDAALEAFAAIDPDKARLVELRFFAGLTVEEVAAVQKRSASTVAREWRLARAWLRRRIESSHD